MKRLNNNRPFVSKGIKKTENMLETPKDPATEVLQRRV
nr:MAG TPA: hypothetical protein [Caudoviricetes sp.]